jgi:hypothetical protein
MSRTAFVAWYVRHATPDASTPASNGRTRSARSPIGPSGAFVTPITKLVPRWRSTVSTTSGVVPDAETATTTRSRAGGVGASIVAYSVQAATPAARSLVAASSAA